MMIQLLWNNCIIIQILFRLYSFSMNLRNPSIKKILYYIITVVILYFFIFNPPLKFMPFGFTKFFYCIGLVYFFCFVNKNTYVKNFRSVTNLFILFVLYTFVIHTLTNSQAPFLLFNIFIFFESFITSFVIAYFLVRYYNTNAEKLVLLTAIMAGVITLFLIMNPSSAYYVRNNLLI